MSEPWFEPSLYGWIPGTVLGTLTGLWGALCGALATQGKGRTVVRGLFWLLLVAGVACLAAGIVGVIGGQPFGVWNPLTMAGVMVVGIVGSLGFFVVPRAYRQAELRRMQAADLK